MPFTAFWGSQVPVHLVPPLGLPQECGRRHTCPTSRCLDPKFLGEGTGTSADDHPLADIRAGDAFLSQVFHAVASGPGWDKTVLVINYDEWGGFFDHVAPHRITAGVPIGAAPTSGVDTDLDTEGKVLSGFRVPCIIASPFTPHRGHAGRRRHPQLLRPHVGAQAHRVALGPAPLTQRDASHAPTDPGNLATALNFSHPVTKVPKLPVLPPFTPTACGATTPTTEPPASRPRFARGRLRPRHPGHRPPARRTAGPPGPLAPHGRTGRPAHRWRKGCRSAA